MRNRVLILSLLLAASGSLSAQWKRTIAQPMPARQVHLDFHTSEFIPGVGARFSKQNFQQALRLAHVNSINIFSKGHHGWSYYPTKVGAMHPSLKFDLLGAEIAACHEIGVQCPIYFTVGWSARDSELHPEWCARNKDGSFVASNWDFNAKPDDPRPYTSWKLLCPTGEYHRTIMKQVEEICRNYDVDGFWFDIYQIDRACYCHNCRRRMRRDGVDINDRQAVIANFAKQYRDHMRALRALVARYHPKATVFFNGTTTTSRPSNFRYRLFSFNTHQDLEDLPTTWGGYDKLPVRAKLYLSLGWPVAAMSGKFHTSWGEFGGFKHPDALRYEAAAMISFGAACNFGDQMHPSGEMDLETYRLIGEAYKYVEKIEDYGLPGIPASRLGLWFTNDDDADRGAAQLLLDIHYDFRVANAGNLNEFDTVIVPSSRSLDAAQSQRFAAFLAAGGKLVLFEKGALQAGRDRFLVDIGADYAGLPRYRIDYTVAGDLLQRDVVKSPFLNYNAGLRVRPRDPADILATVREPYFDRTYAKYCSHRNTPYRLETADYPAVVRHGNVLFFAHSLDRQYKQHGLRLHRQLFQNSLDLLYTKPMLKTDLPSAARVSLLHQPARHRYVAHLLYAPPIHRGEVESIEDLPPLENVPVSLRVPEPIHRVYTIPANQQLHPRPANGTIQVTIPRFQMHTAVVFEY